MKMVMIFQACMEIVELKFMKARNRIPIQEVLDVHAVRDVYKRQQLEDVVKQLVTRGEATESKHGDKLASGVHSLPDFEKDATDRNRTSPFAFTGNKFEFRMVGSTQRCV